VTKMVSQEIIIAVSSGLVAAFVTSFVGKLINDKNISIKYVTEERHKWRDEVKKKTVQICNTKDVAELKKLRTEFIINLNPNDDDDNRIVKLIDQVILTEGENRQTVKNLEKAISLLLKFEWERAKNEAKRKFHWFYWLFISIFLFLSWLFIKNFKKISFTFDEMNNIVLYLAVVSLAVGIIVLLDRIMQTTYKGYRKFRNEVKKIFGLVYRDIG
jgi:phosphate/sulfate permease